MKGIVTAAVLVLLAAATAFAVLGGGDVVFSVTGAANVLFTHDGHAGTAKIGCKECHYAIYTNRANHKPVTMAEMKNGKSCGACHNGMRAFSVAPAQNCPRCHR